MGADGPEEDSSRRSSKADSPPNWLSQTSISSWSSGSLGLAGPAQRGAAVWRRWRISPYQNVAVHRPGPPAFGGPLDAVVAGDDRQPAGRGILADQILQQAVGVAGAGGEADREAPMREFSRQSRRGAGGVEDHGGLGDLLGV